MVETKKISELSVLEQVTEQTYLLVEQEGKACRLPIGVLSEYLGTTTEPAAKEFTFKILNYDTDATVLREYKALFDMTWAEWVGSEYNTDDLYLVENKILIPAAVTGVPVDAEISWGDSIGTSGFVNIAGKVCGTDVISPDKHYTYR